MFWNYECTLGEAGMGSKQEGWGKTKPILCNFKRQEKEKQHIQIQPALKKLSLFLTTCPETVKPEHPQRRILEERVVFWYSNKALEVAQGQIKEKQHD